MSSYSKIAIRNRRDDVFDKFGFGIVFLLGFLWIVFAKSNQSFNNLFIYAIPLLLMLFYVGVAYNTELLKLRNDVIADNAYYLGFLYTLTSLATALYLFHANEGNEQEHIITSFGIALSTTILGVLLRVLIQQLHKSPIYYEREARELLADAVNEFEAEVRAATESFNAFQKGFNQVLNESEKDFGNAMSSSLENFVKTADEISINNNTFYQSLNKSAEKLINTESQLINSIDQMVKKIDDISLPSDLIEKKLNSTLENMNISLEKFTDNIKEEINSYSSLGENINKVSNNIEKSNLDSHAKALSERMTNLFNSTSGLDETVKEIALKCKSLSFSLEESNIKGANNIIEDIRGQYEEVKKLRKSIQLDLEETAKDMSRVRKEMIELSKFIISTTK